MPVYYPEFGDFCDVAADILGVTPEQIARLPSVGLAESALAAPRAGFGDVEVYPTILEKVAILLERLARNHPPPDGNKRTAFFLTGLFLEVNGSRSTVRSRTSMCRWSSASQLVKLVGKRSWGGYRNAPYELGVAIASRTR
jgi:prophage maintenance system killer protein